LVRSRAVRCVLRRLERRSILTQLLGIRLAWRAATNNVTIAVRTASFRRLRGFTAVAVIFDEIAYWFNEDRSANPDVEIFGSRPPDVADDAGAIDCDQQPACEPAARAVGGGSDRRCARFC
jgi:hypothetical protein